MNERFNREDRVGVLHYITLNVRERRQPFTRDVYARDILQCLRERCDRHPAKLIAYVLMPDHLHAIINPRDGLVSKWLSQFKPTTTLAVQEKARILCHESVLSWLVATPQQRPQLWQDGKHSFHLYTSRLIWQKIDYIHNNPLRALLVKHAH